MQRVAKHLYLRGNSYTFRKAIPAYARSAFGGIREYVRSLGEITEARARTLATFHGEYCARLIDEARDSRAPEGKHADILRIRRVPDRADIERGVRSWLMNIEESELCAPNSGGASSDDRIRDFGLLDAEVVRIMRQRNGDAPLMTRWIAEALIQSHDWLIPRVGTLRTMLEDRVARGQRELAMRLRAQLSWEHEPGSHHPTHPMFSAHELPKIEPSQHPKATVAMYP